MKSGGAEHSASLRFRKFSIRNAVTRMVYLRSLIGLTLAFSRAVLGVGWKALFAIY